MEFHTAERTFAGQEQLVLADSAGGCFLGPPQANPAGQPPRLVAREPNDKDLVRHGREGFPGKRGVADTKGRGGHRAVQIELPAIPGYGRVPGIEIQMQVPERLIMTIPRVLRRGHRLLRQRLGFDILAVEQQLADRRKILPHLRLGIVVSLAGPDGIFVELEVLLGRIAKDHRAQPAVTERQGSVHFWAGWSYQSTSGSARTDAPDVATAIVRVQPFMERTPAGKFCAGRRRGACSRA